MPCRRIRAHYKQLSEFERGRIIGLKETGWANWRIPCHMGQSDAAIRRCWQGWVDNGRFQHHDGSSPPRVTADQKDILIVRSAVTAPDSLLSTIRCVTLTRESPMTIHRWLIEQNLHSFKLLDHLPHMSTYCRAKLQWCLAQSCRNHADRERLIFSDESCIQLCPDDHQRRACRCPGQRADPLFPIARHTGPQNRSSGLGCQIL
ncbi:HTH_Tnp_Tc3_2 domain-containing protein [Trichonephila clavipes]|nr:HTH_Tnp_Tc3_2 domain-containing protein [Trichonephila clavipes]